jgi:hypothetical protein
MSDTKDNEPTLGERIAAAQRDLATASVNGNYIEKTTAAQTLDALNGQLLAECIAERDRRAVAEAQASHSPAWQGGAPSQTPSIDY